MTTRSIACALVLSLAAERAGAAPSAPNAASAASAATPALSLPSEAELHARSVKHRGAWLIGIGVPHLAVALGGAFWSLALDAQLRNCAHTPGCGGFEFAPPWLFLTVPFGIVGVVLTAVGLPLFLVGRAREQRLRRMRLEPNGVVVQF
jgi:hypothetical protein